MLFAHAFGQRYELPIPLGFFVFGGALIVFLSFLLVLPTRISGSSEGVGRLTEVVANKRRGYVSSLVSIALLLALIVCGFVGSQEVAENIVPTLFWLIVWIAVPLSCGILGDWTVPINPFATIARLAGSPKLRRGILAIDRPLAWPKWLAWWPAVLSFFVIACGELIFNQIATAPAFTAEALLFYFFISAFAGLVFGETWIEYGEVFSVLFATWGRLGFFRFGAKGKRGYAGGLLAPFEATPSRIVLVLLLLVNVGFDGLLATPFWNNFRQQLMLTHGLSTWEFQLLTVSIFAAFVCLAWFVFSGFSAVVGMAAGVSGPTRGVLAGLLPSLLPISFGYLLAHNIEYLMVNGQLLFPLLGNPVGGNWWPLHLPYPFNDSFEPNVHLLQSSFYWYFSILVVIFVHIVAIVLAHHYLGKTVSQVRRARWSEYPWVIAMVLYTMLSLWLLAQPLVREQTALLRSTQTWSVAASVATISNEGSIR